MNLSASSAIRFPSLGSPALERLSRDRWFVN
jgi:hypothetical protein